MLPRHLGRGVEVLKRVLEMFSPRTTPRPEAENAYPFLFQKHQGVPPFSYILREKRDYTKWGYTLVLLKQKDNAVFGFEARHYTRAQRLENTLQRLNPTPKVSGQHTRSLFSIFKGVTTSNCSAENEGLCEYPFLRRNQEGTTHPQLE